MNAPEPFEFPEPGTTFEELEILEEVAVDRVATIRPNAEVSIGPTPLRFIDSSP